MRVGLLKTADHSGAVSSGSSGKEKAKAKVPARGFDQAPDRIPDSSFLDEPNLPGLAGRSKTTLFVAAEVTRL